jgi:hypothetical protein
MEEYGLEWRKRGENIILDWDVKEEITIQKKENKQWNSNETTQHHNPRRR